MISDIQLAFYAAVTSSFAATPIAWPNTPFDPPQSGAWLVVESNPNDGANYGLADEGPTVIRGFFRVMACTRAGIGDDAATTLAESVRAAFGKGTMIGPARVDAEPGIVGPVQDDHRLAVPVTIRWRATR